MVLEGDGERCSSDPGEFSWRARLKFAASIMELDTYRSIGHDRALTDASSICGDGLCAAFWAAPGTWSIWWAVEWNCAWVALLLY